MPGASDYRQKAIRPAGGRTALSTTERIAEFLSFAIQAQFAYVNKLGAWDKSHVLFIYISKTHRDEMPVRFADYLIL